MSCNHVVWDIEPRRLKLLQSISSQAISIDNLIRVKYHDAKEELLKVYGIGNKIADCILLFSLEKLDTFPIDVWILRALSRYYSRLFNENENENMFKMTESITINQYKVLSAIMKAKISCRQQVAGFHVCDHFTF
jgi:3-methyladenine DNA glycosylase/8-oxoguanine DNA glycosylase